MTRKSDEPFRGGREFGPEALAPAVRYKRKGLLGRGGMASVYKAFDRALRRNVALKIMRGDLPGDGTVRERFIDEAQVTAQLQHPGIIPLYDMGFLEDGRPYFTMKHLFGLTLEEILEEAASPASEWTLHRLLQVFLRICETVAYGHSRRVVHRDLKPSNIMVGEYGEVILMDWGISKVVDAEAPSSPKESPRPEAEDTAGSGIRTTRVLGRGETPYGETVGTPRYMSPEQALGEVDKIDARSDIYSLGVILYRILTGAFPFDDEDYSTLKYASSPPPPPEKANPAVPRGLSRICSRCLAPEQRDRYDSAQSLIKEIHLFLDRGASFRHRSFKKGTRIVSKGDPAAEAYFILHGEAEVHDTEKGEKVVFATLSAGDVFGEMGVFTGEKRNAHVSALTDMEALVFDRESIRKELDKVQPWMGDIINNLTEKLAKLDRKYAELRSRAGDP